MGEEATSTSRQSVGPSRREEEDGADSMRALSGLQASLPLPSAGVLAHLAYSKGWGSHGPPSQPPYDCDVTPPPITQALTCSTGTWC